MKFSDIKSLSNLSSFLRTDYKTMRMFLDNPITILDKQHKCLELERKKDNLFENAVLLRNPGNNFCIEEIMIPKRNNPFKYRKVFKIINYNFLCINKVISFYLNKEYSPIECVSGFVTNRGIVYNAKNHLNKKIILNLDVKDFFESI